MDAAIRHAEETLGRFVNPKRADAKRVPSDLIRQAKGLAFLTVTNVGVILTARTGTGVVVSKLPDGRWSAPSAIGAVGTEVTSAIGAQRIEHMILLNSDEAVKSFMADGQLDNVQLVEGVYGADSNQATAGTTPNYTYSTARGLFVGVGLQGSAIAARSDINKKFYGREITPTEILTGSVEQPAVAAQLYDALSHITGTPTKVTRVE